MSTFLYSCEHQVTPMFLVDLQASRPGYNDSRAEHAVAPQRRLRAATSWTSRTASTQRFSLTFDPAITVSISLSFSSPALFSGDPRPGSRV